MLRNFFYKRVSLLKQAISVVVSVALIWVSCPVKAADPTGEIGNISTIYKYNEKGFLLSGVNMQNGSLTEYIGNKINFTYHLATDGVTKIHETDYNYDDQGRISRITDCTTGKYIQYGAIEVDVNDDGYLENAGWGAQKEYAKELDEDGNPTGNVRMIGKYIYGTNGQLAEKWVYDMDAAAEADAAQKEAVGYDQEAARIEAQIAAKQAEMAALNQQLAALGADAAALAAQMQQGQADVTALTNAINTLQNSITQMEAAKQQKTAQAQALQSYANSLQSSIDTDVRSLQSYQSTAASLRQQAAALEAQPAIMKNVSTGPSSSKTVVDDAAMAQRAQQVASLRSQAATYDGYALTMTNRINAKRTELSNVNKTISDLYADVGRLNRSISDANGQITSLQGQVQTLKDKIAQLNAAKADKDTAMNKLKGTISSLTAAVSSLALAMKTAKDKAAAARARASSLDAAANAGETISAEQLAEDMAATVPALLAIVNQIVAGFGSGMSMQNISALVKQARGMIANAPASLKDTLSSIDSILGEVDGLAGEIDALSAQIEALGGDINAVYEGIQGIFGSIAATFGSLQNTFANKANSKLACNSVDPETKGRIVTSKIYYGKDGKPQYQMALYEMRKETADSEKETWQRNGGIDERTGQVGRLTKQWNYDANGTLLSSTEFKQQWVTTQTGTRTRRVSNGSSSTTVTENVCASNLVEQDEPTKYDGKGNALGIFVKDANGVEKQVGTFTYENGRLIQSTYTDMTGVTTTTNFDALGRPASATSTGTQWQHVDTNDDGKKDTYIQVNINTTTTWKYNDTGNAIEAPVKDADGNVIGKQTVPPGGLISKETKSLTTGDYQYVQNLGISGDSAVTVHMDDYSVTTEAYSLGEKVASATQKPEKDDKGVTHKTTYDRTASFGEIVLGAIMVVIAIFLLCTGIGAALAPAAIATAGTFGTIMSIVTVAVTSAGFLTGAKDLFDPGRNTAEPGAPTNDPFNAANHAFAELSLRPPVQPPTSANPMGMMNANPSDPTKPNW